MSISIHSDFDGGNIEVTTIEGGSAKLAIRRDKDSDFYQWFYFRVDGAAGQALELRITNCAGSAYPLGWPDYRACVSGDNNDWLRAPTSYNNGVLTIRHTPDADTVWFAYFAPYTMDRHTALIDRIAGVPHVGHRVLGNTLDGRALDMLTIGEGPLQIWLYARQHPGETMAEWWMEGALDLLVSDETAAVQLRAAATFYVVPNMNPDGSARGNLRSNASVAVLATANTSRIHGTALRNAHRCAWLPNAITTSASTIVHDPSWSSGRSVRSALGAPANAAAAASSASARAACGLCPPSSHSSASAARAASP